MVLYIYTYIHCFSCVWIDFLWVLIMMSFVLNNLKAILISILTSPGSNTAARYNMWVVVCVTGSKEGRTIHRMKEWDYCWALTGLNTITTNCVWHLFLMLKSLLLQMTADIAAAFLACSWSEAGKLLLTSWLIFCFWLKNKTKINRKSNQKIFSSKLLTMFIIFNFDHFKSIVSLKADWLFP